MEAPEVEALGRMLDRTASASASITTARLFAALPEELRQGAPLHTRAAFASFARRLVDGAAATRDEAGSLALQALVLCGEIRTQKLALGRFDASAEGAREERLCLLEGVTA